MIVWSNCPAVETNPKIFSGAWVFKGTRVLVAALFNNLEEGATIEQFVEWFPGTTIEQVETVLGNVAQSTAAAV